MKTEELLYQIDKVNEKVASEQEQHFLQLGKSLQNIKQTVEKYKKDQTEISEVKHLEDFISVMTNFLQDVKPIIEDYKNTLSELNSTNEIGLHLEKFISVITQLFNDSVDCEEVRKKYVLLIETLQK